jgi:hypothetical protein
MHLALTIVTAIFQRLLEASTIEVGVFFFVSNTVDWNKN